MVTRKPNIILRLLRGLSLLTLISGVLVIAEEILFLKNAHQINAEVALVKSDYASGDRVLNLILRYSDKNQKLYTTQLEHRSESFNVAMGETVVILFNPEDPADIRINEGFNAWLPGGKTAALGFFAFNILGFFTKRRRPKREIKSEPPMHAMKTRPKHLKSPETAEDHAREQSYKPVVTRLR